MRDVVITPSLLTLAGRVDEVVAAAAHWMSDPMPCLGQGRLMYPEYGESAAEARWICTGCPRRVECLEFALVMRETFGVWGATTPKERERIRSELTRRGRGLPTRPGPLVGVT